MSNDIFEKDAFKVIDPDTLQMFKDFSNRIKGKNLNEAYLDIVSFYSSLPKGKDLSEYEREALIQTILLSLKQEERNKFLDALELINSMI